MNLREQLLLEVAELTNKLGELRKDNNFKDYLTVSESLDTLVSLIERLA